jgi:hypothetical protein
MHAGSRQIARPRALIALATLQGGVPLYGACNLPVCRPALRGAGRKVRKSRKAPGPGSQNGPTGPGPDTCRRHPEHEKSLTPEIQPADLRTRASPSPPSAARPQPNQGPEGSKGQQPAPFSAQGHYKTWGMCQAWAAGQEPASRRPGAVRW